MTMDLVPAPAVRLMKSGSEENYSMRSEFLSIFSSPFYDNSLFFFFANLLFHYLLKIILQIFWNLSLYHWSSTILSASILWGSSSISNSLSYGSLLTNHDRDNSQIKYEWKVIEGRILLKKSRIWQESWAQTISWRYKIHWLFIKSYERRWATTRRYDSCRSG